MNDRLQEILINAVEKAGGAIDKGVEFVIEQAPLVVQELLRYKFIESIVYAAIGLIISAVLVYLSVKTWRKSWKITTDYDGGPAILGNIFGLIIGIALLCLNVIPYSLDAVKIHTAPRIYLIEYTANLVKSNAEKK